MLDAQTQDQPQLLGQPEPAEAEPLAPPVIPFRYFVTEGPRTWVVREATTGALVTVQPVLSEPEAQALADRWNRAQAAPTR